MAQHHRAGRNTRKQATRIAVLAFVAADCAGIAYVQHRMAASAEAAQDLAYAQPLVTPAGGAPSFSPTAPVFAMAAPTAVTSVAAAPVAAAPVAAAPVSPRLAVAPAAPVASVAPGHAPAAAAPVLALGSAPAAAPLAHPLRAPRLAPAAGLGHAPSAVTLAAAREAAPVHHHAAAKAAAPAMADSAFANAFTLDGEAPEAEHRFGQDDASSASGNLADLVSPREEPAPIFDKAGIAPVTGQSATVDAPAPTPAELPAAAPTTDDLPVTKG